MTDLDWPTDSLLTDWMIDSQLTDWLFKNCWLTHWLAADGLLADWLIDCWQTADWLSNWLTNYDWLIHDCMTDWLTADAGLTDGLSTDWLIDCWETADWLPDSFTFRWTESVIGWLTDQQFKVVGRWYIDIDLSNFCIMQTTFWKKNYLKIKILRSNWRKLLLQYTACLKY